jgi:hypothetical protein
VFNGFAFDLLALAKTYPADVIERWCAKTFDPMKAVQRQNDGYPKSLDDLAKANGFPGKTMKGGDAPDTWRKGDHDRLSDYCMGDVKILKGLFEKGRILMPAKYKKYEKMIDFASGPTGGIIGRT